MHPNSQEWFLRSSQTSLKKHCLQRYPICPYSSLSCGHFFVILENLSLAGGGDDGLATTSNFTCTTCPGTRNPIDFTIASPGGSDPNIPAKSSPRSACILRLSTSSVLKLTMFCCDSIVIVLSTSANRRATIQSGHPFRPPSVASFLQILSYFEPSASKR